MSNTLEIVWREVLTGDDPPRYIAFDGGAKVGSVSQNAGTAEKFWRWYGAWAAHGNSGRADSRRGAMLGLEQALASYLERTPNAKSYLPYRDINQDQESA